MTDRIQDAAAAFEECIKALLHGKVVNIDRNVAIISGEVSDIKDGFVDVSKGVVEMLKQKNKICETLAEALADIKREIVDRS